MGTEVYVVCIECKKARSLGRWQTDLPEAVTKGSKAVIEYIREIQIVDRTPQMTRALYFAQDHTDKGHKVIVVNEG